MCILDRDWLRSLFSLPFFLKVFPSYTCSSPYTLSPGMWGCKDRKNIDLTHCCSSCPRPICRFWGTLHIPAGHEHYFTGRVSLARTAVSISVAPSLVSPACRANLAESVQSMPSYQVSSETELGTSRAESRRSSSMCSISNNYKMLILAPSSVWNVLMCWG